MKVDKTKLDVSQIFLVYMAVVGDVDKTALSLDLDPKIVQSLAQSEGWSEKIRRISYISKSSKPGEWERAQNRALNFVQAHRVRSLIDRLINHFAEQTPEEMVEKNKSREDLPSAKFLSDLLSAAEKAHHLSYAALGDTVAEREGRVDEEGNSVSAATIHASLIAALNNPAMAGISAEMLVKESSAIVDVVIEQKQIEEPDDSGGKV